jgi:hypothetical protein
MSFTILPNKAIPVRRPKVDIRLFMVPFNPSKADL